MRRLALLLAATGCSMTMRTTPDSWTGKTDPRCDESRTVPAVDAMIAVVGGAAVYDGSVRRDSKVEAVVGGMIAGLFLASAIGGTRVVGRCHDDRDRWDEHVLTLQTAAKEKK